MTFNEMLTQVLDLLQREKRVSYRALKRRFDLDDDYLEEVKDELFHAELAVDEENRVLVWTDKRGNTRINPPFYSIYTNGSNAHKSDPAMNQELAQKYPLNLMSPKSHALSNSSDGNLPEQLHHAGEQTLLLHPAGCKHARHCARSGGTGVLNGPGRLCSRGRWSATTLCPAR